MSSLVVKSFDDFATFCVESGVTETELGCILPELPNIKNNNFFMTLEHLSKDCLNKRASGIKEVFKTGHYIGLIPYTDFPGVKEFLEKTKASITAKYKGNAYTVIDDLYTQVERRQRIVRSLDTNNAWISEVIQPETILKSDTEELLTLFFIACRGGIMGVYWVDEFLDLVAKLGTPEFPKKNLLGSDVLYYDLVSMREAMLFEHGNVANLRSNAPREDVADVTSKLGKAMHAVEAVMNKKPRIDPKWRLEEILAIQMNERTLIHFLTVMIFGKYRLKTSVRDYVEWFVKTKNGTHMQTLAVETASRTRRTTKMLGIVLGDLQSYLHQKGISNLTVQKSLKLIKEIDKKKAVARH